jgi:hypothetical protein
MAYPSACGRYQIVASGRVPDGGGPEPGANIDRAFGYLADIQGTADAARFNRTPGRQLGLRVGAAHGDAQRALGIGVRSGVVEHCRRIARDANI